MADNVVPECPVTPECLDACPATPTSTIVPVRKQEPESLDTSSSENEQESNSPAPGQSSAVVAVGERNVPEIENRMEEDKKSPPPNCAICLGKCKNKCFTDSCLHQFCFKCLLEWSKIKAECPLCKQHFKSIIHNVRSINSYDEYHVQQQSGIPTLRYRIENLVSRTITPQSSLSLMRMYGHMWRFVIYDRKLYANPVSDINGRFRMCTAEFYRQNPAQIHRLSPFIDRELNALCASNRRVAGIDDRSMIEQSLLRNNMSSRAFLQDIQYLFRHHTEQFQHELVTFARSPYDIVGYDHNAVYAPYDPTSPGIAQDDSSIEILNFQLGPYAPYNFTPRITYHSNTDHIPEIFRPSFPSPQVSQIQNILFEPRGPEFLPQPPPFLVSSDSEVAPENNAESDEDNDDCLFVSSLKPPHLRTPEHINLTTTDDDSDVVFVDEVVMTERPINNITYQEAVRQADNEINNYIQLRKNNSRNTEIVEIPDDEDEPIDHNLPSTSRGIYRTSPRDMAPHLEKKKKKSNKRTRMSVRKAHTSSDDSDSSSADTSFFSPVSVHESSTNAAAANQQFKEECNETDSSYSSDDWSKSEVMKQMNMQMRVPKAKMMSVKTKTSSKKRAKRTRTVLDTPKGFVIKTKKKNEPQNPWLSGNSDTDSD